MQYKFIYKHRHGIWTRSTCATSAPPARHSSGYTFLIHFAAVVVVVGVVVVCSCRAFLYPSFFFCVCHFVKMFVMHTFAQNIVFAYTCVLQHMSASYIRVFFSLAFELLYVPDCYHYYVKKKVVFLILLALLSMHNRVMNSKKRKKKKRGACEPWMCEMSTMAKLPYSFPNFFVWKIDDFPTDMGCYIVLLLLLLHRFFFSATFGKVQWQDEFLSMTLCAFFC